MWIYKWVITVSWLTHLPFFWSWRGTTHSSSSPNDITITDGNDVRDGGDAVWVLLTSLILNVFPLVWGLTVGNDLWREELVPLLYLLHLVVAMQLQHGPLVVKTVLRSLLNVEEQTQYIIKLTDEFRNTKKSLKWEKKASNSPQLLPVSGEIITKTLVTAAGTWQTKNTTTTMISVNVNEESSDWLPLFGDGDERIIFDFVNTCLNFRALHTSLTKKIVKTVITISGTMFITRKKDTFL